MPFHPTLSNRPVWQTALISICITLFIGILDNITGYELSFSIFYIVPISIGAWYAGRNLGIFLSFISAMTWSLADVLAGHIYSHKMIQLWNAGVRLSFFVLITILLVRIRSVLKMQQQMAETDGLTSLLNGRTFRDSTTKLLELCRRIKRPITLAYLDLDNFKQINDTLGHAEGDRVLQAVSSCLAQNVRSSDIVGRLGGDEFGMVLPDTNKNQARTVVEKMHLQLKKEIDGHGWPISFSIGVVSFALPPVTADEAIRAVDNLMYQVKKAGKDNILFSENNNTSQAGR